MMKKTTRANNEEFLWNHAPTIRYSTIFHCLTCAQKLTEQATVHSMYTYGVGVACIWCTGSMHVINS